MNNILEFEKLKREGIKITMLTCYDYWSARILDESDVDCILVGDSVAMVMHGYPSTLHATNEMMSLHVNAVARGSKKKLIVADMPFLSFRSGVEKAMVTVADLMRAGAHAVQLEGVGGHEDVVKTIVGSGVPVMGHIGLTPQSIHQLGGFKVQGRDRANADDLLKQAKELEKLGAFALVLECVPSSLSAEITSALSIPTIGIGAGVVTSGQVLVLQDLLGTQKDFRPKFLKTFADFNETVASAVNAFVNEVHTLKFPSEKESYL